MKQTREIKFRAWDVDSSGWIYLGLSSMCGIVDGVLRCFSRTEEGIEHHSYPGKVILEQYTGLKDKNGVEIYEGDILVGLDRFYETPTRNGETFKGAVSFEDACFGVRERVEHRSLAAFRKDDLEVIGNIHQNPDLLP